MRIEISYAAVFALISALWIISRLIICLRHMRFEPKREAALLFVYICLVVVARFTFFPFEKVDGRLQPLVFDLVAAFPPRINLVPFVSLFDYPKLSSALLNLIGNTAMFIPLGIVWPAVYKALDSHGKVIAAGVGVSLCIEILQLPFYDRVSDIDDLLLNSIGFLIGYGIYLLVKKIRKRT